jgi:hypothetical protein
MFGDYQNVHRNQRRECLALSVHCRMEKVSIVIFHDPTISSEEFAGLLLSSCCLLSALLLKKVWIWRGEG